MANSPLAQTLGMYQQGQQFDKSRQDNAMRNLLNMAQIFMKRKQVKEQFGEQVGLKQQELGQQQQRIESLEGERQSLDKYRQWQMDQPQRDTSPEVVRVAKLLVEEGEYKSLGEAIKVLKGVSETDPGKLSEIFKFYQKNRRDTINKNISNLTSLRDNHIRTQIEANPNDPFIKRINLTIAKFNKIATKDDISTSDMANITKWFDEFAGADMGTGNEGQFFDKPE